MSKTSVLRVFYDGACLLCSREISHYQRVAPAELFIWEDIARSGFKASDFGFRHEELVASIHSREESSRQVFQGVETFLAIWSRIPRYQKLQRIASLPFVLPVLKLGYSGFAKVRPYLPKRSSDCSSGSCERKVAP